jgi:REP element-mobilizing transposase RayT
MARPLRLEYPGALYHLTTRGNGGQKIFLNRADGLGLLELLGATCDRFGWRCTAYCLMTNHYHLVVETPEPNLSRGMRQLNGVYTQAFNRRHGRGGHLFQGRFKAILVEREPHLLELARYVVLNPVRAGLVDHPRAWHWSSYRETDGTAPAPPWLEVGELLAHFGKSPAEARRAYAAFVQEGLGRPSPWDRLQGQVCLGSESFVAEVRSRLAGEPGLSEVPRAQRRLAQPSLDWYVEHHPRGEAMARAYLSGAYSQREVAEHFAVHYSTVSRAVTKFEAQES